MFSWVSCSEIEGNITFDLGKNNEDYEAIGRGKMNIENLPVFRDAFGAFGSPTSDSVRTMITDKTDKILLVVINFANHKGFEDDLKVINELLKKYCYGKNIRIKIF